MLYGHSPLSPNIFLRHCMSRGFPSQWDCYCIGCGTLLRMILSHLHSVVASHQVIVDCIHKTYAVYGISNVETSSLVTECSSLTYKLLVFSVPKNSCVDWQAVLPVRKETWQVFRYLCLATVWELCGWSCISPTPYTSHMRVTVCVISLHVTSKSSDEVAATKQKVCTLLHLHRSYTT